MPIHCLRFCCVHLFALNIEIVLADVTKPEKSNISDFDLTCGVISDLYVKFHTMPGKFTYRAIEWRLSFGNRSSSLVDYRGANTPPPQQ